MLLRMKSTLVALALGLSIGFVGCTDDEPMPEEPVQASEATEPAQIVDTEPMDTGFVAETVYFDFDDYSLKSGEQSKLNALGEHMQQNAGVVVQVEGHCDERGSHEYNLALGERRANSVKDYLVQMGIDGSRVTTISYGEERPAVEGHDEGAWGRNRRSEFIITNQ